jgi:two-component system CheB/CheR fusion protein
MDKELQKKLIPLFHYALNAGGFLFLSPSESLGEFENLLARWTARRIYIRKKMLAVDALS